MKRSFIIVLCIAYNGLAQSIFISGRVIDSNGVGITSAVVRLLNTGLTTTTDNVGSFTLLNSTKIIGEKGNYTSASGNLMTFKYSKSTLSISCTEPTLFIMKGFEVNGKQIVEHKQLLPTGNNKIKISGPGQGVIIFKISMNDKKFTLKVPGSGSIGNTTFVSGGKGRVITKVSKSDSKFNDIIEVQKSGLLTYRIPVKNPDTIGIKIEMIPSAGRMSDADSNVYETVRIGKQVWTVENYKSTRYNDGTPIPYVSDSVSWGTLQNGAYCYYNNDSSNGLKYGALYNWHVIGTGKLACEGWRVPTSADWDTLVNYLIVNGFNYDAAKTENKIGKALASRTDWQDTSWLVNNVPGSIGKNSGLNNMSGFNALPGGTCGVTFENRVLFLDIHNLAVWWSATEFDTASVWVYNLYSSSVGLAKGKNDSKWYHGYSVRLVRDF